MKMFLFFLMFLTVNVALATNSQTVLTITHPENATQMQSVISTSGPHEFNTSVTNYMKGLQVGARPASIVVDFNNNDAVAASARPGS